MRATNATLEFEVNFGMDNVGIDPTLYILTLNVQVWLRFVRWVLIGRYMEA